MVRICSSECRRVRGTREYPPTVRGVEVRRTRDRYSTRARNLHLARFRRQVRAVGLTVRIRLMAFRQVHHCDQRGLVALQDKSTFETAANLRSAQLRATHAGEDERTLAGG